MELWLNVCNKTPGKNSFRLPNKDDIAVYEPESILSRIKKTMTPTKNHIDYKMHADDYDLAN